MCLPCGFFPFFWRGEWFLNFFVLNLSCKSKVSFLSSNYIALNSSFFFQAIMPKPIKVWLIFTSTYWYQKCFPRVWETINYSLHKIIVIYSNTNSSKLVSYLCNLCEEGSNSFILVRLQCSNPFLQTLFWLGAFFSYMFIKVSKHSLVVFNGVMVGIKVSLTEL